MEAVAAMTAIGTRLFGMVRLVGLAVGQISLVIADLMRLGEEFVRRQLFLSALGVRPSRCGVLIRASHMQVASRFNSMTIQSRVSVAIDSAHHCLDVMLASRCPSSAGKHFFTLYYVPINSRLIIYTAPPNKIAGLWENCKKGMKMQKKGSGGDASWLDSQGEKKCYIIANKEEYVV